MRMRQTNTRLLSQRFDQCLSAFEAHGDEAPDKLKPGAFMLLLKHMEENILRPLGRSGELPEITYGPDGQSYQRERYENVTRGYEKWASVYGKYEAGFFKGEEAVVWPLLGHLYGKRILDIGCGTGRYTLRFAQAGAHVTGIDMTQEMIAVAEQEAEQKGLDIHFICGDILNSEIERDAFDMIFSSLAITHIADLAGLLKKLQWTLRSRGQIIISDVHPCAKMMGVNVGFIEEDTYIEIPHYAHRIGDYFTAASQATLRIANMIEFPDDQVLPLFLVVVLEPEGG